MTPPCYVCPPPRSILYSAADIDWDQLGFGLTETAEMYVTTCELGGEWEEGGLQPYGPISVSPSSAVINYGQGVVGAVQA